MATEHSEAERHRIIRDALAYRPFATVRDLLDLLTVSPATIRRDIAKLHQSGAIRKVFGGIALPENAASQRLHARPFEENRVLNVAVKQAIAIEAEKLCRDGDTIIVNGGTTCFVFARQLAARALTVFTNSMPVAATLWEISLLETLPVVHMTNRLVRHMTTHSQHFIIHVIFNIGTSHSLECSCDIVDK